MSPESHAVIGPDTTLVVMASARQVKGFIEGDLHDESGIPFGTNSDTAGGARTMVTTHRAPWD